MKDLSRSGRTDPSQCSSKIHANKTCAACYTSLVAVGMKLSVQHHLKQNQVLEGESDCLACTVSWDGPVHIVAARDLMIPVPASMRVPRSPIQTFLATCPSPWPPWPDQSLWQPCRSYCQVGRRSHWVAAHTLHVGIDWSIGAGCWLTYLEGEPSR